MLWLLWISLLADNSPRIRPDLSLTPGRVRELSVETVCATRWGKDVRLVTEKMKANVAHAYRVPWESPRNGRLSPQAKRLRSLVEIDHLIPRSLAGDDKEENLWPQPWGGTYGAHEKDVLENTLHRAVCSKQMGLAFAQETIRNDWIAAYRLYVEGPQRRER